MITGITDATARIPPTESIDQAKLLIIFTRVCPAIIFANNRTPRLTARKQYDTNSRTTKSGAKISGAPFGNKKLKKCNPWCWNPTIVIPMNKDKDNPNVTTK